MLRGVTGLVLTYNGERLLGRCLDSLAFCEHILVVDSFSTDATVEIARSKGATVLQNAWKGPGPQFEYALAQITSHWVLSLDQDEVCSSSLRKAVCEALETNANLPGAYYVARKSWYYNRFMKHSGWYPDYLLRLFRPEAMRVHIDGAHYRFLPQTPTARLNGCIVHYPYEHFAQHLEKLNSYAAQGATALEAKGKKGGVVPGVLHGLGRFCKLYLVKRGFLDGRAGFINAVHGALYAFLKYVRVNEGPWGFPYDHDE